MTSEQRSAMRAALEKVGDLIVDRLVYLMQRPEEMSTDQKAELRWILNTFRPTFDQAIHAFNQGAGRPLLASRPAPPACPTARPAEFHGVCCSWCGVTVDRGTEPAAEVERVWGKCPRCGVEAQLAPVVSYRAAGRVGVDAR